VGGGREGQKIGKKLNKMTPKKLKKWGKITKKGPMTAGREQK
jgi:hypothetical protein